MKYTFPYWGPFVMKSKVEQEFIDILLEKGNEAKAQNNDHRKHLAGMIDNEYYYEDFESWFLPKFTPYIHYYLEALDSAWMPGKKSIKEFQMIKLWINYQKANDYNPPHTHGGDLSFVIFLQVPDKIKKEYKKMVEVYNNSGPGAINFDFGVDLPFSITTYCEFPEVKNIFIFPAWLTHYVHAFKSDEERISASGNIKFLDD